MSANPTITANETVQYIGNLLNIDVSGKLTVMDMIEDLKTIPNLANFRNFIKEKFNYERFRYLTGYQKFIALVNEYKKENIKLDDEQLEKCSSYANKLYYKTISIFDEVNFMVQEGYDIRSKKVSDFIGLSFMKHPKQIKILEKVGKREELLRLCTSNKPELENRIYRAIEELTLISSFPQLAPKKIEGIDTIKKLQLMAGSI